MSIEVKHISKTFGGCPALDDVSLKINAGELVALLGPSGSGKTTLLRIIAGLELPDPHPESAVSFHDEDVSARPVRDRRVGFVFQHYALFRHMVVFDNVAFGLRVRPRRERLPAAEIRRRVEALLSLVQLRQFADRYPSQLSGGQCQRVALARALAVEPKILLLDEPFGALDAKVRQELRQWLRQLHEKIEITTVLVTHDQEEALEVADRVVVMNHGRIEQEGTPEELLHHARTKFVMQFLGQVNVFQGRARRGKVSVGPMSFDYPAYDGTEELPADVYLRPHELEVYRSTNGRPSIAATVERINTVGAVARVYFRSAEGRSILVELSREELQRLGLCNGELVQLNARTAHVFL